MLATKAYLHYWFVHSGIEVTNFNDAKAQAIKKLSSLYQQRQQHMVNQSGDADEMLKIYEDMVQGEIAGQKLSNAIQSMFTNRVTSGSDAGAGNSFAQIALWSPKMKKAKSAEGRRLSKKLANDLEDIINNTQGLLDDLENTLRVNYPAAYTYALTTMCQEKYGNFSANSKKAARSLVQRTLSEGGGIEWVDVSSVQGDALALAKDYVRLKQRLEALRVLNGPKTGYADSAKGEFSARIIGKIGGTLNNVTGRTEELAVCAAAGALLERESQLGKRLPGIDAFAGVTGSGGFVSCQTVSRPSPDFMELVHAAEGKNSASFNKNDVTVIYSINQVLTTLGMSIKTSSLSSSGKKKVKKQLTKVQDTTLASVLNAAKGKDGVFSDFMTYNLAAGHTKSEVSSLQASGVYTMWKSYVDYAIALNIVDYIAGDGSLYSNNILLIANGNVYSMGEVFAQLEQNFDAISRTGSGAFKAARFTEQNVWIGPTVGVHRNQASALARSNQVMSNLESTFQSIRIQIKLDIGALALTSL